MYLLMNKELKLIVVKGKFSFYCYFDLLNWRFVCFNYSDRYKQRVDHKIAKKEYDDENQLPPDELSVKKVFSK